MSDLESTSENGGMYLIRKSGAWYRPNSMGYTTNVAEAGRYTLAEAEAITHPNGPDGPRDHMSYEPAPAALASPAPSESGEPAFWAVQSGKTGVHIGMWEDEQTALKVAAEYSNTEPMIIPLYAHPPSESSGPSTSGVGVTIKPLEWEDVTSPREDGPAEPTGDWNGFGILGAYCVYIFDDHYEVTRPDGEYVECCLGDPDEAKAAAQADYEARIRGALVSLSAPSRDTQPALLSTDETKEGGNG